MNRRRFLTTTGAVAGTALAGCSSTNENGQATETTTEGDGTTEMTSTTQSLKGTLTVGTYKSFVDAPSSSPGPWIKQAFEEQHPNVTLEWETPENALNDYILRRDNEAPIEADVYMGLKVPELVRVDRELSQPLFEPVDTGRLSNFEHVGAEYSITANNRILPVFTGFQSFVYNGYEVTEPETLDALTGSEYTGELTVQNAQTDNTGLYFLLWTIKKKGPDGYLEYWQQLLDNDVRILDTWSNVYSAFMSGETDLITSFSTDQVFAKRSDQDLEKHQVAFPDGHGYSNLSGMGKFATSDQPELASAFMDFMLSPPAQGKLAELNVSFPVTDHATLPDVFEEYAKKPPDPLLFTYDELEGNLETWKEDWARLVSES